MKDEESAERSGTEALGRTLKVRRAELDLSRRDLAKASGLSYSYLAEIENGTKFPSTRAIAAIAQALGLSMTQLMAQAESWTTFITREEEPLRFHDPVRSPGHAPQGARDRQRRWSAATLRSSDPDQGLGRFGEELAAILLQLSPEDRERLLDMARRLADR